MNPAAMSETQLRKALARIDKESSAMCDEFIAAGRGYEKPTDTWKLNDPLALRWKAMLEAHGPIQVERDRRTAWHGTLKRIRA